MNQEECAAAEILNVDVFFGFIAPMPFDAPSLALIDAHYGAEYHNRRTRLSNALSEYAAYFAGLQNVDADVDRSDETLVGVHTAAVVFASAACDMCERVAAERSATPAVEFAWRFVEPALLFNDHYVKGEDEAAYDMQEQHQPPALTSHVSPSTVFELSAALVLLASVQLRLLERERRRLGAVSVASFELLEKTLRHLHRVAHTYVVVPAVESRGYRHPFLCSVHFIEQALTPLFYAQALLLATDATVEGKRSLACCTKAALFNMSADLLLESVCRSLPPLICSAMQRAMLKTLAGDRRAAAYLNLASIGVTRSAKLASEAALSPQSERDRRESLETACAMLEMARGMCDEKYMVERFDALYTRVRVALPDAPVTLEERSACWPILAIVDGDDGGGGAPPTVLDAHKLIALSTSIKQCSVEIASAPESISIRFVAAADHDAAPN